MKPFYFIHLPKTGGTSCRFAIREAALLSGIESETFIGYGFNRSTPASLFVGKQIIIGHISIRQCPSDAITFTLLREPVARVVSGFYFVLNNIMTGYWKTTRRRRHQESWNRILGEGRMKEIASWNSVPHIDDCPKPIVNKFLRHYSNIMTSRILSPQELKKLSAFGLLEKMDKTEEVINSIWPHDSPIMLSKRHMNVGLKRSPPSEATTRHIRKMNAKDVRLYMFAKKLFEERYE